ncbi:MAG: hypothetical protein HFG91_07685 [Acholeplasmatales bacterium]|nr:hypothetical protein [Acholeplasmatales bacterium]
MNREYHEYRIKQACRSYQYYTAKARKIQQELILTLGANPSLKEIHNLNGYLNYDFNNSKYDQIFKSSKQKIMIELYRKYRNITKNYVKLIQQYRDEYAKDESCDHYKKMVFLTNPRNTNFIK